MVEMSAEEMIERLRHSLTAVRGWAELYSPTMVHERARYDSDLDEAEDALAVADAWTSLNADRWLGAMLEKETR